MKAGTWVAIYFVVWWLTLFVVLPIGVRSQQEAGEVTPGSEPGAPAKPNFVRILVLTSLLALAVQGGLWWLIENHWFE